MSAFAIPTTTPASGGGLFNAYALLRDEKASGTNGGTFTSGAWRTRVLNTEVFDEDGIVSLASNQFTLGAGTYFIRARAPYAAASGEIAYVRAKIYNVTDAADALLGSDNYWNPGTFGGSDSIVQGRITIAGTKAFELQHRCATTAATTGFGQSVGGSFGAATEYYSEVEIWREGGTSGGGLVSPSVSYLRDEKTQNTQSGTFSSGAWRTRDLNTEDDPDGIVTLSSNQFTLGAGTYLIYARAPAYQTDRHQCRIQNITDGTTALVGTGEYLQNGENLHGASVAEGRITIAGSKTFELQHQCQLTSSGRGFGVEANFTTEVFATVRIEKVA